MFRLLRTVLLMCCVVGCSFGLNINELYSYDSQNSDVLPKGDEKHDFVKLSIPVNLYSASYDHVYINTNGILTFQEELNTFMNIPFPIDHAAIAPFYANVDTTGSNDTTAVIFYESQDPEILQNVTELVRINFAEAEDFEARSVFVATWENVGHFNAKNDVQNFFQVAVIMSEEETYAQFLYPRNGVNWIQADNGESGLPDIRAQAGFISEDGRFFSLKESGTDNVKHLAEFSNHGRPGSWLYRIGKFGYEDNIEETDSSTRAQETVAYSCADGGDLKCHTQAICTDTNSGFCCKCKENYYGNGNSCIQKDAPIRVSGEVHGKINGEDISAQIQSYVVLADGRSYTAISPLSENVGFQTQLLSTLGEGIGWLFAKPIESYLNGYQLTGGKLNRTSNIIFRTGERIYVTQQFKGLNFYDQLSVDIEVNGEIPDVPAGIKLNLNDVIFQYQVDAPTSIRLISTRSFSAPGIDDIIYTVEDNINYEDCKYSNADYKTANENQQITEKITKVTLSYDAKESALRMGMLNRVGDANKFNPCAIENNCGPNTFCVADEEDDTHECQCKPGYAFGHEPEEDMVYCVDINECADGDNICDPNSECINTPGGYNCQCVEGFEGNGYVCTLPRPRTSEPEYPQTTPTYPTDWPYPSPSSSYYEPESEENDDDDQEPSEPTHVDWDPSPSPSYPPYYQPSPSPYPYPQVPYQPPVYPQPSYPPSPQPSPSSPHESYPSPSYPPPTYPSYDSRSEVDELDCYNTCSRYADCIDGECHCRDGWQGDGLECEYKCDGLDIWDGDKCVPSIDEEEKVAPFCNPTGCTCATGYELDGNDCKPAQWEDSRPETRPEQLPCNIENNCGEKAVCQFDDKNQYQCACVPGYIGDGYDCLQAEQSCLDEDICDEFANCEYDENEGKSVCKCLPKYLGNGRHCYLAPECYNDEDCGINSYCSETICLCQQGYEHDTSDFCVPVGSCGGALCAENAFCKWDDVHDVNYCHCPEGYIGDGLSTCKSIPPQCNIRNNCGLYATCQQNYRDPQKYECVCNSGFYGDGFVCTPEENCINIPSMCDINAKCESTPRGLICVCNSGFLGNGSHCSGVPRLDSGFLLISQGVAIVKVPYDGKAGQPVTMAQMAIGLDKDCATGRFYWSDITSRSIWSAKYDGTDKKVFINEDIISPEGIAVDWISRRLYWTDSTKDTIEVVDLDNSTRRAVIVSKKLVNPRGIAVDPVQNKLYWSDWNRDAPKIEWSNLDGTERQTILTKPEVQLPNSLAIKQQTGEICFADAGTKKIECVQSFTKTRNIIAENLSYPFGLAVSDDHYYWTDWTTKKIESIDVYGKRKPGLQGPLFGNHKMYGMTATTDKCEIYYTQCLHNGECPGDRICLNNYNAPSRKSCKCITGATCNDIQNSGV